MNWPKPKGIDAKIVKDVLQARDGETVIVGLERYPNDRTIRGQNWESCCGCGLRHLKSYEVFYGVSGYYLGVRAYADEKTRPAPKRRSRKK